MVDSCLIAITTPLTEANFITKLITFKEDGKELYFRTLHVGLICEKCYENEDLGKATHCPHNRHKLPPWKSNDRNDRIRTITEVFDDGARNVRENMGMVSDSFQGVFPSKMIKSVFSDNESELLKYHVSDNPGFIVMTIDPGAGKSETAIVSGYFIREPHNSDLFTGVIVGIDASKCRIGGHLDQNEMILKHITELKKRFGGIKIIIIPENQTGFFQTCVCELVEKIPNTVVFRQHDQGKYGVTKTEPLTRKYIEYVINAFNYNCIKFDNAWFTNSTYEIRKQQIDKSLTQKIIIKNSLRDELLRFCYHKDELTGKINGYTDDKAVAFMMFIYWGNLILTNKINNPYITYIPDNVRQKYFSRLY